MKTLPRTLASGGLAGLLSMLVLVRRGQVDSGSAAAPLNAPSHWLYGDKALAQDALSWRYTGTGTAIHHASALMWGLFYDRLMRRGSKQGGLSRKVARVVGGAAAMTAIAAVVDLKLVPSRLTPGFEHRLSRKSLLGVYVAFAGGLALGGLLSRSTAEQGRRPR